MLDREKLSRVLINLLSNAVKNTHEGRVVLRASPWQGSIAFEVEDTGIGIPRTSSRRRSSRSGRSAPGRAIPGAARGSGSRSPSSSSR